MEKLVFGAGDSPVCGDSAASGRPAGFVDDRKNYKRLIREADLMGTSNQRLIKYIKLKVTSYYKIGMHPEDTQALTDAT